MQEKQSNSSWFISKSNTPILLVQAAFFILTIIICLMLFSAIKAYTKLSSLGAEQIKLTILAKDIKYYDEVLTMSARLAISKKDLEWERRYNEHVPLLEEAIDKALTTFNSEQKSVFIKKTQTANQMLIEIEENAFAFAHAEKWAEAENILYGKNYTLYKEQYAFGLQNLITFLQQDVYIHKDAEEKLLRNDILLTILLLITVISMGVFVSWMLCRWQKSERTAYTELSLANNELEEFSYRTSHDLRSPLVSSIALLDVTKKSIESDKPDRAIETLSHVQKSLHTLETLIGDILLLTKTKNEEEEAQNINIETLIDSTFDKLNHMDNFKRLNIDKSLAFNDNFTTKKSRFTLIVENLISNAIKYQDLNKENSFLKISTYNDGQNFVLEVEDNGLGIPQDQQEKLFMMFKRFHPKASFGSGLGLYMMKKSADIIGGNIIFENKDDGSIFKLFIPRKEVRPL